MTCSRPEFQPSDSISTNCDTASRNNYALLPYRVAPMAPSGPIEWGVKRVTSLLDLIAESCRKSYDPLTCIQGVPGFWVDLAQKFRNAGLGTLVDTGYDSTNNCFWTTGATYTIPPIDPNSLKDFDMTTYPWGKFFDLTYYFRTAPANVRPRPQPANNWGVYQLYEYTSGNCSGDPLSECRYVAMSMNEATGLGNSCHAYISGGYSWEKTPEANSFKIHSTVLYGLEESEAKNTASKKASSCGYYVYELVYSASCGSSKVCECQYTVLNEKRRATCNSPESAVPSGCPGAQKVKYVEKGGPFTTQAEAEAKKAELEAKCGSSSSTVLWYVYRKNHHPDMDCMEDPDDTICDFIVSTDPDLDLMGCYNGISYTKAGDPSGYLDEEIANTIRDLEEDDCRGSSSSGALPWHVYKKDVYPGEGCSGETEDDCLYIASDQEYTDGVCMEEEVGYVEYHRVEGADFATEQQAQDHADILMAMCRPDSSSSGSATPTKGYCLIRTIEYTADVVCSEGVPVVEGQPVSDGDPTYVNSWSYSIQKNAVVGCFVGENTYKVEALLCSDNCVDLVTSRISRYNAGAPAGIQVYQDSTTCVYIVHHGLYPDLNCTDMEVGDTAVRDAFGCDPSELPNGCFLACDGFIDKFTVLHNGDIFFEDEGIAEAQAIATDTYPYVPGIGYGCPIKYDDSDCVHGDSV